MSNLLPVESLSNIVQVESTFQSPISAVSPIPGMMRSNNKNASRRQSSTSSKFGGAKTPQPHHNPYSLSLRRRSSSNNNNNNDSYISSSASPNIRHYYSSSTNRSYNQTELQYREQVQQHLMALADQPHEERRKFLKQLHESNTFEFLATLPDTINPIANEHLKYLQVMDMPTQAFTKMKPTNGASRMASSALPVCHYPETREAILALLGPETDSGTFPQSLLSAPLTTRLGVTVSSVTPENFLGMARTKSKIDHASFREEVIDRGGLTNKFNSMRIREVKAKYGIVGGTNNNKNKMMSSSQKGNNTTSVYDGSSSSPNYGKTNLDFLDLDKDFVPSEDDEDDYVAINPDGSINFNDLLEKQLEQNAMRKNSINNRKLSMKDMKMKSGEAKTGATTANISMNALPSGADLEEFPPILADGIRSAAIEIMERHLGPRMKFLITRQRRLAVMGQQVDFSAGGVVMVGGSKDESSTNNAAAGNNGKRLSSFARTGVQQSTSRNRSNAAVPSKQVISQIARNHSLGHVQQMSSDAMKRGCAPLQFLLPSSASSSASASSSSSPLLRPNQQQQQTGSFDLKFPSGIHFPLSQELMTNSSVIQLLSSTEKMHFASNSGPYSPTTSFFAHWTNEAIHSLLNQGFLQIVPADTQLCYQGCPVAIEKRAENPSIYIILAGTCEATIPSILPSADASVVGMDSSKGSSDLFSPNLLSNNNTSGGVNNGSSALALQHQQRDFEDGAMNNNNNNNSNNSSDEDSNDSDGNENDPFAGFGSNKKGFEASTKSLFGGRRKSITSKEISMRRRKSSVNPDQLLSMINAVNNASDKSVFSTDGNTGSGSNANNSIHFAQKKTQAWESFYKAKGENFEELHSAGGNSSPSNPPHSSSSSSSLGSLDTKVIEDALFPTTSSKHQHYSSSVMPVTPFLVNPSRNNSNVTNKIATISSTMSSPKENSSVNSNIGNKSVRKNLISATTALGPFGLSASSFSSGAHSMPYPCSLRTKTRCEIFVIPYWCVVETMKNGNFLNSNGNNTNDNSSAPSSPTGGPIKKSSPAVCNAEALLHSTACHHLGLSLASSCCGRFLRRIPWLLRSNSSSDLDENSKSIFFSAELRDRIASAFRPILIDQDSLCQYRSAMSLTSSSSSAAGGHHHSSSSNHQTSSSSASADPLGFLILPQINTRARVQLIENTTSAETAVVTIDALNPTSEVSKRVTAVVQTTQSRLRTEEGIEFCEDSCFGFGLREVFVTAGRRLMANNKSLFSNSNNNNNNSSSLSPNRKDDDDSGEADTSSSSSAIAHIGTSIAISTAKMTKDEMMMVHAEKQFSGLLGLNSSSSKKNLLALVQGGGMGRKNSFGGASNLAASFKNFQNSSTARNSTARSSSKNHQNGIGTPGMKNLSLPSSPIQHGKKNNNNNNNNNNKSSPKDPFDDIVDNSVSGYILCFVVSASELQKRLTTFITAPPSSNNSRSHNTAASDPQLDKIYSKRREETKLLIQEADVKLVQYRTSAMATSAMKDDFDDGKNNKKAPKNKKNTTGNNGDDGGSDSDLSENETSAKKKTQPSKTVNELLSLALERYPIVGPACTFADRNDILNVFSLLFEFKRYRPHSLLLSKSEVAADRIIVILKGKVILNSGENQSEKTNMNDSSASSWKNLTFAGTTTVLPHRWSCSAVAITEVTTAEASRSLVLPFLKDTRFYEAMKIFAEAVMSSSAISAIPNFVVPDVVKMAMRCFSGHAEVHPVLPQMDPSGHNVYGVGHRAHKVSTMVSRTLMEKKNAEHSTNNVKNDGDDGSETESTVTMNNAKNKSKNKNQNNTSSTPAYTSSFVPYFNSKQEQQYQDHITKTEAEKYEKTVERLNQTVTKPPLFGEERLRRDHLKMLRRQEQLEKEAEKRKKEEAQKRKEDRERKSREEKMMMMLSPLEGGDTDENNSSNAASLGSTLLAKKSASFQNLERANTLPPTTTKEETRKGNHDDVHQGSKQQQRQSFGTNNKLLEFGEDDKDDHHNTTSKTPDPTNASQQRERREKLDFLKHHEQSYQPHPSHDAEDLLRAKGVILKHDFFLKDAVDPLSSDKSRQNNSPVNNKSTQNRKVIGHTHKSLGAGLWMRKRAPVKMPK